MLRRFAPLHKRFAFVAGNDETNLEQDEIRLGRDDGPSRAQEASGVSAASRGPFYFA